MTTIAKNTICIWYDGDAEEAARFYAATFPDSRVDAVHRAPADYPSGKAGDVLTVMFTVMGIPCMGLNGGPAVQHNIAFSFQVATTDQTETDRYWNAIIGNDEGQDRRRRDRGGGARLKRAARPHGAGARARGSPIRPEIWKKWRLPSVKWSF